MIVSDTNTFILHAWKGSDYNYLAFARKRAVFVKRSNVNSGQNMGNVFAHNVYYDKL